MVIRYIFRILQREKKSVNLEIQLFCYFFLILDKNVHL